MKLKQKVLIQSIEPKVEIVILFTISRTVGGWVDSVYGAYIPTTNGSFKAASSNVVVFRKSDNPLLVKEFTASAAVPENSPVIVPSSV